MDPKRAARQRVTELLRRFFEGLKGQLATGTTDLWQKVQQRVSPNPETGNPRTSGPELSIPPGTQHMPVQPQPMQQQQSKTQDEKRDEKQVRKK